MIRVWKRDKNGEKKRKVFFYCISPIKCPSRFFNKKNYFSIFHACRVSFEILKKLWISNSKFKWDILVIFNWKNNWINIPNHVKNICHPFQPSPRTPHPKEISWQLIPNDFQTNQRDAWTYHVRDRPLTTNQFKK